MNRLVASGLVALTCAAFCAPAVAAGYPFTVENYTRIDITGVSVRGGKVVGFERVMALTHKTFSIEPDEKCLVKRIRIKLENGAFVDRLNYNACVEGGIGITGGYRR